MIHHGQAAGYDEWIDAADEAHLLWWESMRQARGEAHGLGALIPTHNWQKEGF